MSNDDELTPEQVRLTKLVDDACVNLSEHFDSIRIFVTMPSEKPFNTANYSNGRGNIFAQIGQVREWLIRDDERTRVHERENSQDS